MEHPHITINKDNEIVINDEYVKIPDKILNSWENARQYLSYIHYVFESNSGLSLYDMVKELRRVDLDFYHNTLEFWKFLSGISGIDIGISKDVINISTIAMQGNHKLG